HQGSDQEKKATLQAYVYALSAMGNRAAETAAVASSAVVPSSSSNPHITLYILSQLCQLIQPPQQEQQCLVTFKKIPSQVEFIRGDMRRSPYLSSFFARSAAGGGASGSGASGSS